MTLTVDRGTIKGFVDKVSAGDGETVSLFVTTPAATFDVAVYRLGWYDGGARSADLVAEYRGLPGIVQPAPQIDSSTGLVSAANWARNGTFTVAGWKTGLYLLKLQAADGDQNYIPLVVRDDRGRHDVLFETSSNTDQAYNGWGGKSLYTFNSSKAITVGGTTAAVKVTFDRPYDKDGAGVGVLGWELNMIRWLEANGFDVAYVADVDVHENPQFAARAKAVIQAGHNEYWSKEMRDHLEAARDSGKNLGFFTGDTGAWAVRFEDSSLGHNRILVCYRDASLDPVAASDPSHATVHFRDPPLNRPTQAFIGVGTNAQVDHSADWTADGVANLPDLFAGTGFHQGDVVPNLVGYEYDGLWTPGASDEAPTGLQRIGHAIVIPGSLISEISQFKARYDWPSSSRPSVGQFSTNVETVQPGPSWSLMVYLVSAKRSVYLQYLYSSSPTYQYQVAGETYAVIPIGKDFTTPGWHPFVRNLLADYTAQFGKPSDDLRIAGIVARGSFALGKVTLTAPNGEVASPPSDVAPPGDMSAWRVIEGTGTLTLDAKDPSGNPALVLTATLPGGRRPDEADTVIIKRNSGGSVVAAGTIQWSWALDDVGKHVDGKGDETKVDSRIQALTRNILKQFIRSGAS
jgi:hypothetical protein